MRFRFWCSKAFWLGLPGLVFLAWGWWHSMGHMAGFTVYGRDSLQFLHGAGEVFLVRGENTNVEPWRTGYASLPHTEEQLAGAKRFFKSTAQEEPDFHAVFIPYPYLILGYLAVWSGVLAWRGRRYRMAGES